MRNDIQANVLHLPGQIYSTEGDTVSNVYTFKLINKTNDSYDNLEMRLMSHQGKLEVVGGQILVPKGGLFEGTLFIKIEKKDLQSSKEKIEIGIYSNGELIEETNTNFSSPLQLK